MLKPNINTVPWPQLAAQSVRTTGQRVGRLFACLDRRWENAGVYVRDGLAWLISADDANVGWLDWLEFRTITRGNRHWNVAGVCCEVVASSKGVNHAN